MASGIVDEVEACLIPNLPPDDVSGHQRMNRIRRQKAHTGLPSCL